MIRKYTQMEKNTRGISPIIAIFLLLVLTVLLVGLMSEFVFGFMNIVQEPADGDVQFEAQYEEFNNTYAVDVVVTSMDDSDYLEIRYSNPESGDEEVERLNKVGLKTTIYVEPESSVRVVAVRGSDGTATLTRQWTAPSQ